MHRMSGDHPPSLTATTSPWWGPSTWSLEGPLLAPQALAKPWHPHVAMSVYRSRWWSIQVTSVGSRSINQSIWEWTDWSSHPVINSRSHSLLLNEEPNDSKLEGIEDLYDLLTMKRDLLKCNYLNHQKWPHFHIGLPYPLISCNLWVVVQLKY